MRLRDIRKIIANKDAILADAQAKADNMIEEAHIQTNELVSEHEIMQQAYAQANDIVTAATEQAQQILDNATRDANDIRIGAMQYTDDLLANAESIIGHTLDSYTAKYDGLIQFTSRSVLTWYVIIVLNLRFQNSHSRMPTNMLSRKRTIFLTRN